MKFQRFLYCIVLNETCITCSVGIQSGLFISLTLSKKLKKKFKITLQKPIRNLRNKQPANKYHQNQCKIFKAENRNSLNTVSANVTNCIIYSPTCSAIIGLNLGLTISLGQGQCPGIQVNNPETAFPCQDRLHDSQIV